MPALIFKSRFIKRITGFAAAVRGAEEDRDVHAAKNMILFAKRQIEADRLESKRVENETSMAVSSDNAWIRPTKHEAARSLA